MPIETVLTLPDLLSQCPFSPSTNPHYEVSGPNTAAWLDKYFHGDALVRLKQARTDLLINYTYPYVSPEFFQLCSDNMNLLFVVDGISDKQDGFGAEKTREMFLKALKGEPCEDDVVPRMTRDFMEKHGKHFEAMKDRYLQHNEDYISSVVKEAGCRKRGEILRLDEYRSLRRNNSGVIIAFDLIEVALGFTLSDEVFNNPAFKQFYYAALDLVNFSNDVLSYKVERAQGLAGCNVVTVLMHYNGLSLQEATDHVGFMYQGLIQQMLQGKASLPSYGASVDVQLQKYMKGLEDWVVGSLHWSYESVRYFGEEAGTTSLKVNRRVIISDTV